MKNEHVFIEQTKVLRLVCYKAEKMKRTIAEVCHNAKTRIDESCKYCVFFKIQDETRIMKELLRETELNPETAINSVRLKELPFNPEAIR